MLASICSFGTKLFPALTEPSYCISYAPSSNVYWCRGFRYEMMIKIGSLSLSLALYRFEAHPLLCILARVPCSSRFIYLFLHFSLGNFVLLCIVYFGFLICILCSVPFWIRVITVRFSSSEHFILWGMMSSSFLEEQYFLKHNWWIKDLLEIRLRWHLMWLFPHVQGEFVCFYVLLHLT